MHHHRPCWLAFFVPDAQAHEAPYALAPVGVALQFTSRVAVQEEALLLELSGSLRLWGGLEPLKRSLFAALRAVDMAPETVGQGATAGQALALLRLALAGLRTPASAQLPDGLPLHTLSAVRPHVPALSRMGCNTWGDLRVLPRAGVARRFGAAVLLALDQALGTAAHSLRWVAVPEVFDLSAELPALADSGPALLYSASRLLQALQAWLQTRQQGVLVLEFSWKHELRRHEGVDLPAGQSLPIRTAQPTQDMAHLRRLLAEFLDRTVLAAPANQIRLVVCQSATLPHANADLLGDGKDRITGMSWHELIERLGARLGPRRVQALQLRDDHRPEAMQCWQAATGALAREAPPPSATQAVDARLLPAWLVRPALALRCEGRTPLHHGPLELLAGPQRLESGWWNEAPERTQTASDDQKVGSTNHAQHAPHAQHARMAQAAATLASPSSLPLAVRDYFVAHNDTVGLVWVYRERLPAVGHQTLPVRWFLQGLYG